MSQIFACGAYYVFCQVRLWIIKYGFEGSVPVVDLISTPGSMEFCTWFQFCTITLIQNLLLEILLKVRTLLKMLEDAMFNVFILKKEKIELLLTSFLWHVGSVKSLD